MDFPLAVPGAKRKGPRAAQGPASDSPRRPRSGPTGDVSIILLSAGEGRRLGRGQPKGWVSVGGRPLLVRAIESFASLRRALEIVAVVHPAILRRARAWMIRHRVRVPVKMVLGGRTRQDSVRRGLDATARQARFVLTHDVARPLIRTRVIEKAIETARRSKAAIVAARATDTLVVAHASHLRRVLDRDEIAAAQTPQVFETALLKSAHEAAARDRFTGSDEATLVARLGRPVSLVWNDSPNLKITLPHDLVMAETLLRLKADR